MDSPRSICLECTEFQCSTFSDSYGEEHARFGVIRGIRSSGVIMNPKSRVLCARWYLTYPLSYRQLAEMLNEMSMDVHQMKKIRICFVGDSFVNGTGDPECLGWTGRICATAQKNGHDITYYNLGVRRQTSADIAARWQEEVNCRLPKECDSRIVFSFGVNDITLEKDKPRVAFNDIVENTYKILNIAKQRFPVLMIGPPPIINIQLNSDLALLSKQFALICRDLDIPYLDVLDVLLTSQIWLREAAANDASHPRAGGYSELAQLIQNWSAWQDWLK